MHPLEKRDLSVLWHPCTPMKWHESLPLMHVVAASGCYLTLNDGRQIFDALSSWWCKSLGHGHPRLQKALITQMNQFEHVMLAGITHQPIVELSERLTALMPGLSKVFYAGDGSCAVEIALKMSLHVRHITGETHKNKFMLLENAYHGETMGAMSVSDLDVYQAPYASVLFHSHVLRNIPYVTGANDTLWHDASAAFAAILPAIETMAANTTALIIEPIVQGAAGMKIISADFLRRLCLWARENNIHIIADEIMTGFGRTGKMLAMEHVGVVPDFMCLSKGMTSGWLAMSAMLTTNDIYQLLYTDKTDNAFLHSHTYTGNALGAALALETLSVFEDDKIVSKSAAMTNKMLSRIDALQKSFQCFENIRAIGAIAAFDIADSHYTDDFKIKMLDAGQKCGVHLRPLGKTVYWLPPLIATEEDLNHLADATHQCLSAVFKTR